MVSVGSRIFDEHDPLLFAIDNAFSTVANIYNDIENDGTEHLTDDEMVTFIFKQIETLMTARQLTIDGHYRESYSLIRNVLEAYLLFLMISVCDKYLQPLEVRRSQGDSSLDDARSKLLDEIKNHGLTIHEQTTKTITLLRSGLPIVDSNGQPTGEVVPLYQHAWHNYQPENHHLKNIRRFLIPEWSMMSDRTTVDDQPDSEYYRRFFNVDSMQKIVLLNGRLSDSEIARFSVHYNYLSGFVHTTHDAMQSVPDSYGFPSLEATSRYNHYHSELSLLYILHITGLYVRHYLYYMAYYVPQWRNVGVKNRDPYDDLLNTIDREFGYFWFIFNKPHQYDHYAHANRISDYRKRSFVRPEQVQPEDVGYYDDPLRRLKEMHSDQRELTSGNVYISPFHRDDARFP